MIIASLVGWLMLWTQALGQSQGAAVRESGTDWAEVYVQLPVSDFVEGNVRAKTLTLLRTLESKRVVKVVIATEPTGHSLSAER